MNNLCKKNDSTKIVSLCQMFMACCVPGEYHILACSLEGHLIQG